MTRRSAYKKPLAPLALALASLLAVPAVGEAATNFGSRLNNDPANSGECQTPGPCTLVSYIHPSDPNGDPYSGGAPVDGVITKFRIRAYGKDGNQPATVKFRLANLSNVTPGSPDSALAQIVAEGPTVQIAGTPNAQNEAPIYEFPGRVPVKKGNQLAIDATDVQATYNNSGNEFTFRYNPPLAGGQGPRASTDSTGELLVAATIEPDADGDGFGDETQDRCSSQRTTQGDCDRSKPNVSGTGLIGGRRFAFRLSEPADVKLTLQKAAKGRKVGRRCRKQTRRNRSRRRCTRYVRVKGVTVKGVAGLNRVSLSGRKLKKGRYRVIGEATDAAGNRRTFAKKFRVKK